MKILNLNKLNLVKNIYYDKKIIIIFIHKLNLVSIWKGWNYSSLQKNYD